MNALPTPDQVAVDAHNGADTGIICLLAAEREKMLGDRHSVLSDVPEDDVVQAQAKELLKRAKSLDTARRGYMEESQRIIGKQQDAIEHLKSENRRIKEDLDAETKVATIPYHITR